MATSKPTRRKAAAKKRTTAKKTAATKKKKKTPPKKGKKDPRGILHIGLPRPKRPKGAPRIPIVPWRPPTFTASPVTGPRFRGNASTSGATISTSMVTGWRLG